MNNIITLRRLVEIMAQSANLPEAQIEQFVKALTSLISQEIINGETVSINGVGEFKLSPSRKVIFTPDTELASEVNSPFDIFEPEPLAEGITVQDLVKPLQEPEREEHKEAIKPEPPKPAEPIVVVEVVEETEEAEPAASIEAEVKTVATEPAEPIVVAKPTPTTKIKPELQDIFKPDEEEEKEAEADDVSISQAPVDEDYAYEETGSSFPTFWALIGLLVGLILGIGIGFFMHDPIEKILEPSLDESNQVELIDSDPSEALAALGIEEEAEPVEEIAIEPEKAAVKAEDMAPKVEEKPAKAEEAPVKAEPKAQITQEKPKAVVYETIRPGVYLSTLAKKHYNEKNFWVYIYLENQSIIKNPNRVPEGTRLVIPPIEKYATQATQAERVEAARKKVSEVLKKYPN